MTPAILPLVRKLSDHLARMIEIQSQAYPPHWTPQERREAAERHLFGEKQ